MASRPPTLVREQSPPYKSLEQLQQKLDAENAKNLFLFLSKFAYEGSPLGVCRPNPDRDHPNYENLLSIFLRNLQRQLASLHGRDDQIKLAEEFKATPYDPNHFFALANVVHEIVEEYVFREFEEKNAGETRHHILELDNSNPPLPFIPTTINRLNTLVQLNLSQNTLTALPSSLFLLRYLEILDVSFNQLTQIPNDIRYLNQLRDANFSDNQIRSVPRAFQHLSRLLTLNLANNRIEEFDVAIETIDRLEVLQLSSNRLTSFTFGFATRLKFVNLSQNPLTDIRRVFQLPEKCYIGLRMTHLDISKFSVDLQVRGRNLDISTEASISQKSSKKRDRSES